MLIITDLNYRIADLNYRITDLNYRIADLNYRIADLNYRIADLNYRIYDPRKQNLHWRFQIAENKTCIGGFRLLKTKLALAVSDCRK